MPADGGTAAAGFRQCILYVREGEPTCPEDYPDEFVFYGGLDDTRACTPCECTETAPSTCTALVSYYQDAACTTILGSSVVDTTSMAGCSGIMVAGAQLVTGSDCD